MLNCKANFSSVKFCKTLILYISHKQNVKYIYISLNEWEGNMGGNIQLDCGSIGPTEVKNNTEP